MQTVVTGLSSASRVAQVFSPGSRRCGLISRAHWRASCRWWCEVSWLHCRSSFMGARRDDEHLSQSWVTVATQDCFYDARNVIISSNLEWFQPKGVQERCWMGVTWNTIYTRKYSLYSVQFFELRRWSWHQKMARQYSVLGPDECGVF